MNYFTSSEKIFRKIVRIHSLCLHVLLVGMKILVEVVLIVYSNGDMSQIAVFCLPNLLLCGHRTLAKVTSLDSDYL